MSRFGRLATCALALAACGRVGYDARVQTADAGRADAAPDAAVAAPDLAVAPDADTRDAPAATGDAPAAFVDGPAAPIDAPAAAADLPGERALDAPDAPVAADAPPPPANYRATVPALAAPPRIDGVLDGDLPLQAFGAAEWFSGKPRPASDGGEFAVGWRPDGLYVYVHVRDQKIVSTTDETKWCEDAVEIFFDVDGVYGNAPSYDATGTRQFIVGPPRGDTPESRIEIYRMAKLAVTSSPSLLAFPAPGGYVVEGLIGADLMGTPVALAAGGHVGLDVQIDVTNQPANGTCSTGDGSFILQRGGTSCRLPYCDVGSFVRPVLAP